MRFLITAGGTREYIDPVRFITNASSGKMGYALAYAALKAGHSVTLVSACDMQPPVGVDFVCVESAAEMFAAVKKNFSGCDCLIMAAAVSDYTPVKVSRTKIKKGKKSLLLKLKPTFDILKWAGEKKIKNQKSKIKNKILVGFALEDKNVKANAQKKLKEKNLDMIIANKPEAIGGDYCSLLIKTPFKPWQSLAKASKRTLSEKVISLIEKIENRV
jgi:phosphopantothenoylcysteine decarboxylase/phosphopantothenate--cysteine ligase